MINCDWVRNPFSCSTAPFTGKTIEEFIKHSSDCNLKLLLINKPQQVLEKCSKFIFLICKRSSEKTFAFCNYLLCETGCLHYVSTETKNRSRLDTETDMYIKPLSITPDIKSISTFSQAHSSN